MVTCIPTRNNFGKWFLLCELRGNHIMTRMCISVGFYIRVGTKYVEMNLTIVVISRIKFVEVLLPMKTGNRSPWCQADP